MRLPCNPAKDLLTIKWSGITAPNVQISVIKMEGQQLYTTSASTSATYATIPVSALPDWQNELIDARLKSIEENPDRVLPIDSLLAELDRSQE